MGMLPTLRKVDLAQTPSLGLAALVEGLGERVLEPLEAIDDLACLALIRFLAFTHALFSFCWLVVEGNLGQLEPAIFVQ